MKNLFDRLVCNYQRVFVELYTAREL